MKGEKGIGDIKRELFDDNVEGLLLFLDLLRKGEGQDAVVIGGADGRGVDVLADGEGTLIRAVAALFADELVALVAVLRLGMSLRGDGDHILVHSDVDVLLLEAGEIRGQLVAVTLVGDIRAEGDGAVSISGEERVIEEVLLEVVHCVKRVVRSKPGTHSDSSKFIEK